MGLVGFDLVMKHPVDVELGDCAGIWQVASLPVTTVLKAAAYLDRPADRHKDLADIAYLLDGYREECRFDVDDVEFEAASAFMLGRDLRPVCDDKHRKVLREFLSRIENPDGGPFQTMVSTGPNVLHRHPEILADQIMAYRLGVGLPPDC